MQQYVSDYEDSSDEDVQYLTVYHQSSDDEEVQVEDDNPAKPIFPPGRLPGSYPGSHPNNIAAYHAYLASISRGGFGPPPVPAPAPAPGRSSVRIKGCPVCNIRSSHVKEHALRSHLPSFLLRGVSRGKIMEPDLMAEASLELLEEMAALFGCQGRDGPWLLWQKARRVQMYPQRKPDSPYGFTWGEKMVALRLNDLVGAETTATRLEVSPPGSPGALLHWRTLVGLVARLPDWAQDRVYNFQPECLLELTGPAEGDWETVPIISNTEEDWESELLN